MNFKKLLFITLSLISINSFADKNADTVSLYMRENGGRNDYFAMDLYKNGNIVGGQTSSGGQVYLKVDKGTYAGLAGSRQLTSLKCVNNQCSGFISGHSADFSLVSDTKGSIVAEKHSTFNMRTLEFLRTENRIYIRVGALGLFDVKRGANGVYRGTATVYGRLFPYEVTLTTKGALDFSDPVLATIFLGSLVSGH